MGNLLTLNFWFNSRPESLLPASQKALIGFIVFCFLLWLVCVLWAKRKNVNRKILKSFASFGLANFILGLLFWFFSFERIPILSAKFWYVIWFAGIATWLYFIYKRYKKIELMKEQAKKEKELKRYIP